MDEEVLAKLDVLIGMVQEMLDEQTRMRIALVAPQPAAVAQPAASDVSHG